jgi:hypothetical protein
MNSSIINEINLSLFAEALKRQKNGENICTSDSTFCPSTYKSLKLAFFTSFNDLWIIFVLWQI